MTHSRCASFSEELSGKLVLTIHLVLKCVKVYNTILPTFPCRNIKVYHQFNDGKKRFQDVQR